MSKKILYCHCAYEQILDAGTKQRVLAALAASDLAFDAVPDLCALSARRDPSLAAHASGELVIAACFPRAVRWLFHAAGAPLDEARTTVLNMRDDTADDVIAGLLGGAS